MSMTQTESETPYHKGLLTTEVGTSLHSTESSRSGTLDAAGQNAEQRLPPSKQEQGPENEKPGCDPEKRQDIEANPVYSVSHSEEAPVHFVDSRPVDKKTFNFTAWTTVLGVWIFQFCGFGYTNAFGVYQDYYVRIFLPNRTSSQISWIGSVQVSVVMAAGVITGRLFDKGYFYHLMISGFFILSFSTFMLSLCKPDQFYQAFLAQGVGMGIGAGLTYIPSVGVVSHHFPDPHKRVLVMCIVASGSSMGGILHPIMLNNLFNKGVGFAKGVRASAGLLCGLQIIALCLMRAKYTRQVSGKNVQLVPLGTSIKKLSRDKPYVIMITAMSIFVQGLFFPIFYIQLDAIKHGLDANFSFYSLTILNAASLVGRVLPGFHTRRFGVINMVVTVALACNILIWSMFGVTNVGGVAAFSALYGFFSGAWKDVSLLAPMLASLADHPTEIGARMGIGFAFVGLGSLIGTPITGALLTTRFIWWRPTLYSGVLGSAGVLIFLLGRIASQRKRKTSSWIM